MKHIISRKDLYIDCENQHIQFGNLPEENGPIFHISSKKRKFSKILVQADCKKNSAKEEFIREFYEKLSVDRNTNVDSSKQMKQDVKQGRANKYYDIIEIRKTRPNLNVKSLNRKMTKRPNKCDICYGFFTHKSVLNEHIRNLHK